MGRGALKGRPGRWREVAAKGQGSALDPLGP